MNEKVRRKEFPLKPKCGHKLKVIVIAEEKKPVRGEEQTPIRVKFRREEPGCPQCKQTVKEFKESLKKRAEKEGIPFIRGVELYDVQKRVEQYFKMNALKCPRGEHLGVLTDGEGNVIVRPEDFGIHTVREWKKKVDHELEWIKKHKKEVLKVLPALRSQWSESCAVLRKVLGEGESK